MKQSSVDRYRKLSGSTKLLSMVGKVSSIGLLGLCVMLLCPVQSRAVSATDCQPGDPAPCATAVAETTLGVELASSVSIAIRNHLAIEVIPHGDTNFVSTPADLAVATNNPSGYTLYMQASKITDGAALLVSDNASNTSTISPVTGKVTSSSFGKNTWGYSMDGVNYQAVPATTSMIYQADTATSREQHDLSFGVAIDASLPAGYYSNSIIVSAVANPRTIYSLMDATYMQDMDGTRTTTSTICAQSKVGDTKQLIDTRDGKKYWVAKLADENCWMVQNLDYDLSTSKPLTPESSDVTASWTPAYTTSTTNNFNAFSTNGLNGYSWDVGTYVLATPQRALLCTNGTGDGTNSVSAGQSLSRCSDFQQIDQDWVYTPADTGNWNGYNGLVAANKENKTYDSHYLVGNYYQWNAAAAGSTAGTTKSICPKGWQIPEDSAATGAKSFQNLLKAYGYPITAVGAPTPIIQAGATRPDGSPIFLVRSGGIDLTGNLNRQAIRDAGKAGFLWISVSGSLGQIYLEASDIYPSFRYGERVFPVRCVAR